MKKQILIAIGSFVMGAALFVGLTGTLAAPSDNANTAIAKGGMMRGRGPAISQEDRTALDQAFQNNDYNAWKTIMEKDAKGKASDILSKINESNFAKFAEAHRIMKEAKEKSAAIFKELGIERPEGKGEFGPGKPGKGMMRRGLNKAPANTTAPAPATGSTQS